MITPLRHLLPWRAQVLWNPRSLFGGGAPTPVLTPPPTMPDANSPDVLAARKLAISTAMNGGRASTQLTTPLAAGGGAAGSGAGSFAGTKTGG